MIPRRLIRTVPAATSPQVEDWWARFAHLHPQWDTVTFRDPIDPAGFPLTAPHWAECTSGAQRAGLIRLEALWHLGGVYVDSDVEPLRPFDPLLALDGFAAWEDAITVPDAVLGFAARHPAVDRLLDLAIGRLARGAWESGPGVTTEILPRRHDVVCLPPGVFYPYHYTERHRAAEDFSTLPWCLAVHHWHASWLPQEVSADER